MLINGYSRLLTEETEERVVRPEKHRFLVQAKPISHEHFVSIETAKSAGKGNDEVRSSSLFSLFV